jgi:hypothetical protein
MSMTEIFFQQHENNKSCWNCRYQRLDIGTTLLGMCTWFSCNGKKDKEIHPEAVDVGCKFFTDKTIPWDQGELMIIEK